MIVVAVAALIVAPPICPSADPRAQILALHETAREAHLRGDAALIAGTIGDRLLLADNGAIRVQSQSEVRQFFAGYFGRVRYRQWSDVRPPVVEVSPDGQMAWMAVEIEARYTPTDPPAQAEKSFKSSWIATYGREGCVWRMTGIASDIVE